MLEEIKQAQFNHCPKHPGNQSDLLCIHPDCKKYLMCSDCDHTPNHPICTIHDLVSALHKLINYENYTKGPSLIEAEQNLEISFQTIFMELKSLKQFFKTQYNYMKDNLKHYIQEQQQTHGIYSFIKAYSQQSGSLNVQLKSNLVPNLHFEGSQCYLKCNTPKDSQKTSYDFLKIVQMLQAKTQQLAKLSRKIQSEYALQVENYRQKLSKSQTIVQDDQKKQTEQNAHHEHNEPIQQPKQQQKEIFQRQESPDIQQTTKQEQDANSQQYYYYKKKQPTEEKQQPQSDQEIVIDIDDIEVPQYTVEKVKGRPRKNAARVKTRMDGGIVTNDTKIMEGRQKKWISIFEGKVFYLDLLYPKQTNRQPIANECLICKCNIRFPQYKSYNYQPLRYGDLCGPVQLNDAQFNQLTEGFNERKDKTSILPQKEGGIYFHELQECVYWSNGIKADEMVGQIDMDSLISAAIQSQKKICFLCKLIGPTIRCTGNDCEIMVHYRCFISLNETSQKLDNENKFSIRCPKHFLEGAKISWLKRNEKESNGDHEPKSKKLKT